mmetsp:Transcript_7919/g.28134  ORF Transcript_7919/g.28134 Transcript_7919/m.28134 type:complete len:203 (+) Transcript_7919:419-1027(+)
MPPAATAAPPLAGSSSSVASVTREESWRDSATRFFAACARARSFWRSNALSAVRRIIAWMMRAARVSSAYSLSTSLRTRSATLSAASGCASDGSSMSSALYGMPWLVATRLQSTRTRLNHMSQRTGSLGPPSGGPSARKNFARSDGSMKPVHCGSTLRHSFLNLLSWPLRWPSVELSTRTALLKLSRMKARYRFRNTNRPIA